MIFSSLKLLSLFYIIVASKKPSKSNIENDLRALGRSIKENDLVKDDYGLSEDYDYDVDESNNDRFKTLSDKTLFFFIENYKPGQNNSDVVRIPKLTRPTPPAIKAHGSYRAYGFFVLRGMNEGEIMALVNARPEAVVLMSQNQLEGILVHQPGLMRNMTRQTVLELAGSQILADKFAKISKKMFVHFIINNQFALDFLKNHLYKEVPKDTILPSIVLLRRLLLDDQFLRLIPLKIHLELAESNFVQFLSIPMIKAILKANPEILVKFGPRGMKFVSSLLKQPDFINQLSCSIILNGATNTKFLNQLPSDDLKAFSRSPHFWRCLPVEIIREIMMNNRLADKLTINDVVVAAQVMSASKSLDQEVVVSLLQIQFPKIAQKQLSEIFDP